MEEHSFGECPICGQGQLVAMKSSSTGHLLVMCDECESQWQSPDQAQSFKNALPHEIFDIQRASLEEIRKSHWLA